MRFRLDYPAINCRQCGTNYEEDEIEPDCEECPVSKWDDEVHTVFVLHSDACIWGDLEHGAINQALRDRLIPVKEQRKFRRCVVAMHRLIQEDAIEKQRCQIPKPE